MGLGLGVWEVGHDRKAFRKEDQIVIFRVGHPRHCFGRVPYPVQGFGFRVVGLEVKVSGSWITDACFGCRVQGVG